MQDHIMRDGNTIPPIGLGTYGMDDVQAEVAVAEAIRRGYRLIDTAQNYRNEHGVGQAIQRCGVEREELFVTTKIPGRDHGFDTTINSVHKSLERLNVDYLDLCLIHWPNPSQNLYVPTWKALVRMQEEGKIRSIGVSNFLPEHIDRIVADSGVTPAVNQIELSPFYRQEELTQYNAQNAIITQCWSPLGRMKTLKNDAVFADIAQQLGVTPAQVALRWAVQQQMVPIPKSANLQRMEENIDVFTWELNPEQMKRITEYDKVAPCKGYNPLEHEEM
ncbi:aldo/keto reductase [Rothia sp. CCM 9418]|uniref:aldo/keto reductase n=1 Tax=Rothia sp. CCM 9418 TaxID=3402661 RepID=UPI003AE56547